MSGARVTMLGFSLVASIVIYRYLAHGHGDLVQAGQFAISMAIVRMLTNSIGSASDLVVLRRVPELHRAEPAAAADVVRSALLLRVAAFAIIMVLALSLRSWFAEQFLGGPNQGFLVLLIGAAAIGELLLRSSLSFYQAIERFDRFVAFEAMFQAGRLGIVLFLAETGQLSVTAVLMAYAGTGLVVAALGVRRLPGYLFTPRPVQGAILRDAAGFFCWTVVALGLAAGTERVDLFLLGHFRGTEEVGLYGGVLTLALIPDFVVGLLATVLQPRVIRLRSEGELADFNRRMMLALLPIGVIALLVIASFGHAIVTLALGVRFAPGVPAFIAAATGSLTWLVLTPVSAVLINLTAPRMSTALTGFQMLLLIGGGIVVIPVYGLTGAAVLLAITRIVVAGMIIAIAQRMMQPPGVAARPSID